MPCPQPCRRSRQPSVGLRHCVRLGGCGDIHTPPRGFHPAHSACVWLDRHFVLIKFLFGGCFLCPASKASAALPPPRRFLSPAMLHTPLWGRAVPASVPRRGHLPCIAAASLPPIRVAPCLCSSSCPAPSPAPKPCPLPCPLACRKAQRVQARKHPARAELQRYCMALQIRTFIIPPACRPHWASRQASGHLHTAAGLATLPFGMFTASLRSAAYVYEVFGLHPETPLQMVACFRDGEVVRL